MTQGSILAWLNADDCWVVPNAVSRAVAYLTAHPEVDVVYGEADRIDAEGNVVGPGYWRPWDFTYAIERCNHCITQPAAFLKRQIVERVGWLDPNFIVKKDHELWLRIGLVGTIRHSPILLAHERACPGRWSRQGDLTAAACVALTKKFFELPHVPERLRGRRRAALSVAYLRGAQYAAIEGRHYAVALIYAIRGLWLRPAPLRHLLRYGWRRLIETLRLDGSIKHRALPT